MVMVYTHILMVEATKASGLTESSTGKAYLSHQQEPREKEFGMKGSASNGTMKMMRMRMKMRMKTELDKILQTF